jgi:hypothetical protein
MKVEKGVEVDGEVDGGDDPLWEGGEEVEGSFGAVGGHRGRVEGGDEFVEVGNDLRVKDGSVRGARRRREGRKNGRGCRRKRGGKGFLGSEETAGGARTD